MSQHTTALSLFSYEVYSDHRDLHSFLHDALPISALLYFTGSKEHNVKIRGIALKKKMTLSEWGLYKLDEYDKAKKQIRSEEHTSELQSHSDLVCRLLLEKKKKKKKTRHKENKQTQ